MITHDEGLHHDQSPRHRDSSSIHSEVSENQAQSPAGMEEIAEEMFYDIRRPSAHVVRSKSIQRARKFNTSTIIRGIERVRGSTMKLSMYMPLRLCGVLPWCVPNVSRPAWKNCSAWYQRIVLLFVVLTVAATVEQIVATRQEQFSGSMCYGHACLHLGLLSDIAFATGCAVCLLSLGAHRQSRRLAECMELLTSYCNRYDSLMLWHRRMQQDFFLVSLLWFFAVVERARGSGALSAMHAGTCDLRGALQIVSFAVQSSSLMSVTLCVLSVCHALGVMVDSFCCEILVNKALDDAVPDWNTLSATMRRASDTIEHCFFVLQTTALCVVVLGMADTMQLLESSNSQFEALIPGLLITLGMARIFFVAASVTDKCSNVPSLVNSLYFGQHIDHKRQYVVEYIVHSAAGFYVFEIRLTSGMVLKCTYFCLAAGFTAFTTIVMRK